MKASSLRFLVRSVVLGAAVASAVGCTIKPADPLPPPPAAKVDSFTVSPTSGVKPGDMVTLTWATSNATSVAVEQVGVGPVSTTALSGTAMMAVQSNAIFVVTARGEGGSDALSRGVAVGQTAADLVFAALPGRISAGQAVTLTWFAPGAQTVTLAEVGGGMVDLAGQKENGTVTVTPSKSTSWKLTADGREATASVVVAPVIGSFTLSSAPPAPGGTLKLAWTTSGAQSLVLKRTGSANPLLMEMNAATVAAGDFQDTAPADLPADGLLNYTLEATSGGQTVSAALTVHLAGALKILTLDAQPYARVNTDVAVNWRTQGAASVRVLVDGVLQYQSTTQANTDLGSFTLRMGTAEAKVKLVARNAFGGEVQAERTISIAGSVGAPTFTVTPNTVAAGGAPVTLTWSAAGARRARVVENGLLTVAIVTGAAAESGTAQAWPNTATTSYELFADNTLDAPVYARATATVTTPITMANADGGTVITSQGAIDLVWNVTGGVAAADGGTEVVGFPTSQPEVDSTGFDDISLTGNIIAFSDPDNSNATFATDFETVLGGRRVSAGIVTVSTNGALVLGSTNGAGDFPTTTWPSATYEANFISPYWADLDLVNTAHWQIKGTAPNRVLIVQWTKAQRFLTPTSDLTFQAKIYQSGQIDFEYATFNPAGAATFLTGVSLSRGVGISNSTVAPSSNKRRTFFGPIAAAPNVAATTLNVAAVRGYARMPNGGLMQLGFDDHVRPEELSISEVMYAPAAPYADAGEWFEVVNRSPRPVTLTGWNIEFGGLLADGGPNTHTITAPIVVPAGGVKVFGQSSDAGDNGGAPVDYAYGSDFAFNDLSGTVALSRGTVRVAATWTSTMSDGGASAMFDPNPVVLAGVSTISTRTCKPPVTTLFGAQRGSPGVDTTCLGYRLTRIDQKWRDITRTGTPVTLTAALGSVDLTSAPITLWGAQVTSLAVSQSGWLVPGTFTGTNVTANKTSPSAVAPVATIAPFWDNLVLTSAQGSGIYAQRFAAGADAETPAAHWVVQWSHASSVLGVTDDLNFEVKFFDSGAVEYHYGSMESGSSSVYGGGASATLWFESPDAGTGAAMTLGNGSVVLRPTNTLAWRFSPTPQ